MLAVFVSWLSHELEWIRVHTWSGYSVLVLVGSRLLWGFWGSAHSLFRSFLKSPATVVNYWRGDHIDLPGHNPAGGWAALLLLVLLLLQALTGLFNSDELLFDGPLFHLLDAQWTDRLGAWHQRIFWVLLGVIILHVAVIAWYQLRKGQDILWPMFNGGENGTAAPISSWRALSFVLVCAGLLALALYLAPEPQLPW